MLVRIGGVTYDFDYDEEPESEPEPDPEPYDLWVDDEISRRLGK